MSTSISTPSSPEGQLTDLALRINEAHADALTAARTTLEHARRVGELLTEAKRAVTHGNWLPWLKENVKFSVATATRYMNVAADWDRIANSSSVTNLTEATALLADAPQPNDGTERAKPARRARRQKSKAERYRELHVPPIDEEPLRQSALEWPNGLGNSFEEDGNCTSSLEPAVVSDAVHQGRRALSEGIEKLGKEVRRLAALCGSDADRQLLQTVLRDLAWDIKTEVVGA